MSIKFTPLNKLALPDKLFSRILITQQASHKSVISLKGRMIACSAGVFVLELAVVSSPPYWLEQSTWDAFLSLSKPLPSLNPKWRSLDQTRSLARQNTPALQASRMTASDYQHSLNWAMQSAGLAHSAFLLMMSTSIICAKVPGTFLKSWTRVSW